MSDVRSAISIPVEGLRPSSTAVDRYWTQHTVRADRFDYEARPLHGARHAGISGVCQLQLAGEPDHP
jgi:hypothetical protein